jgi:hypothetical protein
MRTLGSAIVMSCLMLGAAVAQTAGPPAPAGPAAVAAPTATTGMAVTREAPVGHRQPTPGSLPPGARQDEDAMRSQSAAENPYAGVATNICRGC